FSGRPRHVLVPPQGEHYDLRSVAFSPDGRMLAVEPVDGVVEVWETASGRRRRRFLGHRSYQTALAFSPDRARLARGSRDATVLVWDVFGMADDSPAPLADLWTDLHSEDAQRASLAMGQLLRRPDSGLPFLKGHLLRAKSALAARIRGWVADLDCEQF